MSIVVLPHLMGFLIGFAVIAGLALVLSAVAVVATSPVVVESRRTRLRRHEGVLHYYGHLALGH